MLELAERLLPALRAALPVAIATSIDLIGGSPHPVGTSMAVTADGSVIGSVSGGCVETAALDACTAVLADGRAVVRRFGFGDAEAARAGLACGGELDVLVHRIGGTGLAAELAAAAAGRPAAVAVVTAGPAELVGAVVCGGEGRSAPDGDAARIRAALGPDAVARIASAIGGTASSGAVPIELGCDGTTLRLLVESAVPAPRMLVVGATEVGRALAAAALALGYRVTVCDARPAFASRDRVPPGAAVVLGHAHRVLAADPPGARDVVCVVSHDDELDPLALAVALESGAGFVGALGSRGTHARRVERLRALGVAEDRIRALHAPIGLDIGASTPAETAVSILAEVIAARTGGSGDALRARTGPIHRPHAVAR